MGVELDRLFYSLDAELTPLQVKFAQVDKLAEKSSAGVVQSFQKIDRAAESLATRMKFTGAEDALARLQSRLNQIKPPSAEPFIKWGEALRTAAAITGIGLGVEAVREVINFGLETVKSTADLEGQSKALGISTRALQVFRIASVEAGAGADVGDTAIQRFTRSIGEAFEVAGPARKAFADLGLTAADLAGGTESALPKAAAALLKIRDATERARIEAVLFSRSGQTIEQVLEKWGDPTALENIRKYGPVIDEALIKKADDFEKAWNRGWLSFKVGASEAIISMFNVGTALDSQLHAKPGAAGSRQFAFDQFSGQGPLAVPGGPHRDWGASTAAAPAFSSPAFDKFVANQKLSLELSRMNSAEQQIARDKIAAADAKIQDMGESEKVFVGSVAQAEKIIGAVNSRLIEQQAIQKGLNQLAATYQDVIGGAQGAHQTSFEAKRREEEGRIAESVGRGALQSVNRNTDQFIVGLKRQGADEQYMRRLRESVDLAGMLTNERESEALILERQGELVRDLTQDEKEEIRGLVKARQDSEKVVQAEEDAINSLGNALDAALQPGANLRDIMKGLEADIGRIITRLLILEPLEKSIRDGLSSWKVGDGSSSGGGDFGSILSSVFSSGVSAYAGGGGGASSVGASDLPVYAAKGMAWARGIRYAAKGDVLGGPTLFNTPGGPVMGGELGQDSEALVPLVRGPSGHLGVRMTGGKSGPTINLTQVISVAPDVSAIARQEVMRLLPQIGSYSLAGVQQYLRRG